MRESTARRSGNATSFAGRNVLRPRMGRNVRPVPLPRRDIETTVHDALVADFPAHRAKLAAACADVTEATAKNWFRDRNSLSLSAFINIARTCPHMRAAARRLLELDDEADPELIQRMVEAALAIARAKQ